MLALSQTKFLTDWYVLLSLTDKPNCMTRHAFYFSLSFTLKKSKLYNARPETEATQTPSHTGKIIFGQCSVEAKGTILVFDMPRS